MRRRYRRVAAPVKANPEASLGAQRNALAGARMAIQ